MSDRIEGEIRFGEAAAAGKIVARRFSSGAWHFPVGLLIGVGSAALGSALGVAAQRFWGFPTGVTVGVGLAAGTALAAFVGLPAWRRVVNLRFKRRLAERGIDGPFPVSYEATLGAFVYTIGGVTKSARWEVCSELFKAQNWWVLMAQGEAFYIPCRLFPTSDAERAFVGSIMQRLNDGARRRSDVASALLPIGS